jgi:RNA polymerase sigma-70 factor (ECF subfamily)
MTGQPDAGVDPADRVTLDESISMAFLIVLESMTPAERVAFVLHDVFRYPFNDISQIVGRSPAACRQLASSARRRLRPEQYRSWPSASHSETVRRFKEAWQAQDLTSLVGLLDPHATVVADGGGLVSAALEPIEGASRVALAFVELLRKAPDLQIVERSVNGHPGLVVQRQGTTVAVMAVEVCGDHITRVWAVRNPEKLRHWVMD